MPKDKSKAISQQIFAVGLPIKEVATARCGSQHFELEAEIYPVNQRQHWKCERNIKVKRLVKPQRRASLKLLPFIWNRVRSRDGSVSKKCRNYSCRHSWHNQWGGNRERWGVSIWAWSLDFTSSDPSRACMKYKRDWVQSIVNQREKRKKYSWKVKVMLKTRTKVKKSKW